MGTLSWFEIAIGILNLGIPLMLFLVQRARTEQQALQREIGEVKHISQDVQIRLGRIDQRVESHELSDAREFAIVHEDIRELRESRRRV